jgi:transposase-like protein
MGKSRAGEVQQRYSDEFRSQAVGRMRAGARVKQLSRELNVARSVLFEWRSKAEQKRVGFYEQEERQQERKIQELRGEVRELQAKVGQQAMELDFFRGALRRVGAKIPDSGNAGKNRSVLRSAAGVNRKAD